MKKLFALLVLLVALLLTGCQTKSSDSGEHNQSGKDKPSTETGEKITGNMTVGSDFSEGYAFVKEGEKIYCIDKSGSIVFEVDKDLPNSKIEALRFSNGVALIDGGICDTSGKITYPEDVGVTKFYRVAFRGGYIVAEKVTSDYSSTKKELGVMNMNFEWVLSPSEEIYAAVAGDLWLTEALNTQSFYSNGFIYFQGSEKCLDINTGEVLDWHPVNSSQSDWIFHGIGTTELGGTYCDSEDNVMLDLRQHENLLTATSFINGKAAVFFYNQSAGTYFFTIIDKSGAFAFDPVEIKNIKSVYSVSCLQFDGEYVVVAEHYMGSDIRIQSYNMSGELLGELKTSSLPYASYTWELADSVFVLRGGNVYYFNPDFTPLFE